jgi:hypothetical protein
MDSSIVWLLWRGVSDGCGQVRAFNKRRVNVLSGVFGWCWQR